MCALEGHPQNTAKMAMDNGDGTLCSIMETLDSVYGGSTMYTALMNKLNTIQQGNGEVAKNYYECMVQIRVKLQEFHHYMFQPRDLEHYTKNTFNGLRPEYQAMVVHKPDNSRVNITQLLIAICECEENEVQHHRNCHAGYAKAYPPSTSRPPYWTNNTDPHRHRLDNAQQDQSHHHQQDNANNNSNANVTIHAAQVESMMEIQAEEDYIPQYINYDNPVQDWDDTELTFYTEVYTAAIRMADDTEW